LLQSWPGAERTEARRPGARSPEKSVRYQKAGWQCPEIKEAAAVALRAISGTSWFYPLEILMMHMNECGNRKRRILRLPSAHLAAPGLTFALRRADKLSVVVL
jgi:hypothetical protein